MKGFFYSLKNHRCSLRLAAFFVLLNLVSCRTSVRISSDNMGYMFENVDDKESYFIRLDTVENSFANGRIYSVTDALVMRSKPILINMDRNKWEAYVSDTNHYTLKFSSRKRGGGLEGKFVSANLNEKKKFVLKPYGFDDDFVMMPNRYREEIFEVEKISDVNYAKVKGFWSSIPDDTIDVVDVVKKGVLNSLKRKDLNLDMDIYLPKDDTISLRPLMMFVHGGAFFLGDKATAPYQKWCTHFASLGYVCVSINYRMGFRMNPNAIERAAYQATQDAHAAMRFLLSHKKEYRIDPDYLFVGGASAGSITAMNMAYMRNKDRPESSYAALFRDDLGDIETSGNNLRNKFNIRAVANMWGSIYDLGILKNSKTPIISFHGDEDDILPYGFGYPFKAIGELQKVFFSEMYGSKYIHEKALELGIRSELHTFHGQGHALHLDEDRNLNDNFYTIQNEIVDFFYDELISNPANIIQSNRDMQWFAIDTTDVLSFDWDVVGGISIKESEGKIRASWFDDDQRHELRVSGFYKNGAGFEDVFVIKNVKGNEDNSYE